MQNFKAKIEARLADLFDANSVWQELGQTNPEGVALVRSALLSPGKRLRPRLFASACKLFDDGLLPAALALELAHNFILIHDDIIDRSATRHGVASLSASMQKQFDEKPSAGFAGSDFALVAGDILYSMAIEQLVQVSASAEQQTEAVRFFMQAAQKTGEGALREMDAAQRSLSDLKIEEIEQIYALKTGAYTFTLPLQLAAVFSNVWNGEMPDFLKIGHHAGIAFQLRNDLNALQRWSAGGAEPDDVRDCRRTWPLVFAGSRDALLNDQTLEAARRAIQRHDAAVMALLAPHKELGSTLQEEGLI